MGPPTSTTVNVAALANELSNVEENLQNAEKELDTAKEELEQQAAEVAAAKEKVEDLQDINNELDNILPSKRRRRSLIMHPRIRRASGTITLEYCPEGTGSITDTGFNLMGKAFDDVTTSIENDNIPLAECLIDFLKELTANSIDLTDDEKQALLTKKDNAKSQTEAAVKEN